MCESITHPCRLHASACDGFLPLPDCKGRWGGDGDEQLVQESECEKALAAVYNSMSKFEDNVALSSGEVGALTSCASVLASCASSVILWTEIAPGAREGTRPGCSVQINLKV